MATTQPKIAAEWSEKNEPLKADEVNEKSRQNVWWRCQTCGNEWKAVVNTRVKGAACPVCTDRAVLAGYNDLATTDRHLLAEWDFEKNTILPTEISRLSMKIVWWKCPFGHMWRAKISDRTLLKKGCIVCDKEYDRVFPALTVGYYASLKGLKVQLGSDKLLGITLEAYLPSEKLAIEWTSGTEQMEILKVHDLCKTYGKGEAEVEALKNIPWKNLQRGMRSYMKIFFRMCTTEAMEIRLTRQKNWGRSMDRC